MFSQVHNWVLLPFVIVKGVLDAGYELATGDKVNKNDIL